MKNDTNLTENNDATQDEVSSKGSGSPHELSRRSFFKRSTKIAVAASGVTVFSGLTNVMAWGNSGGANECVTVGSCVPASSAGALIGECSAQYTSYNQDPDYSPGEMCTMTCPRNSSSGSWWNPLWTEYGPPYSGCH